MPHHKFRKHISVHQIEHLLDFYCENAFFYKNIMGLLYVEIYWMITVRRCTTSTTNSCRCLNEMLTATKEQLYQIHLFLISIY